MLNVGRPPVSWFSRLRIVKCRYGFPILGPTRLKWHDWCVSCYTTCATHQSSTLDGCGGCHWHACHVSVSCTLLSWCVCASCWWPSGKVNIHCCRIQSMVISASVTSVSVSTKWKPSPSLHEVPSIQNGYHGLCMSLHSSSGCIMFTHAFSSVICPEPTCILDWPLKATYPFIFLMLEIDRRGTWCKI